MAVVATGLVALASPAPATQLDSPTVIRNTDFASFGVGGMRGSGSGTITVSGVSGTVTEALLYWNGPTNSTDPNSNASVTFAGQPITGTNIGTSSDNCWRLVNSQSYRADVTSDVSGNGSYALSNFLKTDSAGTVADVNGASLIVFFHSSNQADNKDVTIVDGNDSNVDNPNDTLGWDVTIPAIDYSGGAAHLQLHVSDGQSYPDGAVTLNSTQLVPAGSNFQGDSVLGDFASVNPNPPGVTGNLWDIKNYTITSFMSSPSTTLNLTSPLASDCLSLVTALVDVPTTAAADLSVTKSGSPDPVLTNSTLTYTINVTNGGSSPAHDVLVTDTLPNGTTFQTASGTDWSCTQDPENSSLINCSRPTLAVGPAPPITITVTAPSSPGSITNNVVVTADEQDPNGANNSASATTAVAPQADLAITKSDTATGFGPDPVSSGQVVAFKVSVTNNGPNTATGITVTDSETGGTIVGASGANWSCSFTSTGATCTRASLLASGATADPITIQVKAPMTSTQATISDTSAVSGFELDPNHANNQATESTTVNPSNTADFAAGFYDGTHTLDIQTVFGLNDSFRSEIIVPPSNGTTGGYQASPVTDQENSATNPLYIKFCGNTQCDGQVDVSSLPSGSQAGTPGDPGAPIQVILYYTGNAKNGDAVYAQGDGQTGSHLLSKCDSPTVAMVHGVVTKCVASDTTPPGQHSVKKIVVLVPSGFDPTIGKH